MIFFLFAYLYLSQYLYKYDICILILNSLVVVLNSDQFDHLAENLQKQAHSRKYSSQNLVNVNDKIIEKNEEEENANDDSQ